MWSDNETDTDLLGFTVHKDLIRHVITDQTLMPVTVGVFGDWGGGKSSILRMLKKDLENEKDTLCLYFNGWTFEGYDDAKAALISSILVGLGEHKRFEPKVRDEVVSLLKRVNYMRFAAPLLKHAIPIASTAATALGAHLIGADPHLALQAMSVVGVVTSGVNKSQDSDNNTKEDTAKDGKKDDSEEVDWQKLIDADSSAPGPLDLRKFRSDFERLLTETKLKALVVLIDDLDRCSPERLIENLEAIKLFLAVPHTSFVIAADERIIRHAISRRYEIPRIRNEESAAPGQYDLVTDYLEKLIQVPYHLPRLSPSEIESYITLLFCQLEFNEKEDERFNRVHKYCTLERAKNLYLTIDAGVVQVPLENNLPPDLHKRLQWAKNITPALAEGMKGNPRQVKRLLNALLLRKQLAEVAKLDIRDEVLVKLMLLEYTRPDLFDQLYIWQAQANGHPPQLKQLEEIAVKSSGLDNTVSANVEEIKKTIFDLKMGWWEKSVQDWLKLAPSFVEIDLRDYFWVARDRLHTTLSELTMVPPYVRILFNRLVKANEGERRSVVKEIQKQDQGDQATLIRLLTEHLRRQPKDNIVIDGFKALIDANSSILPIFVETLKTIPMNNVEPDIPSILDRYRKKYTQFDGIITDLLTGWAKESSTRVGMAAKQQLESNNKKVKGH